MAQNPVPSAEGWDFLYALERRLAAVEGRTLRNVVIPEGGLTIREGGHLVVESGNGTANAFYLVENNDGKREMGITRDNGKLVLRTFGVAGGQQAWALHDNNNDIVVSDDGVTGQGLARPSLPWTTRRIRFDSLASTDNGSFEGLVDTGYVYKSHPRVYVQVVHCATTSGTTGELRLMLDGVQVGSTQTVGFVLTFVDIGPFSVPGSHMSQHRLILECRRTGGTGRIGADMVIRNEAS